MKYIHVVSKKMTRDGPKRVILTSTTIFYGTDIKWNFFTTLIFFYVLDEIFAPPCLLITSCLLNRYYRVVRHFYVTGTEILNTAITRWFLAFSVYLCKYTLIKCTYLHSTYESILLTDAHYCNDIYTIYFS